MLPSERTAVWRGILGAWVASRAVTAIAWWTAGGANAPRGFISWDGAAYVSIAEHGYRNTTDTLFFPLFPWLTRIAALGLPGSQSFAAVVVSNMTALLAGWMIWKLAETIELPGAHRTPVIWMAWPAAFVTVLPYSEGVATVTVAAALWYCHRGQWLGVGIASYFAVVARPTGLVVAVAVLVTIWMTARRQIAAWLSLLSVPLGMLTYHSAVREFGGWSNLSEVQRRPERRGEPLDPIRSLFNAVETGVADSRIGPIVHAVTMVIVIGLLVYGWKRLPRAWWAFSVVSAIVTFGATNLDSTERYTMVIVPLALVAAALAHRLRAGWSVLVCSFGLQGAYAYAVFRGRAVP
jgi:hypothetical protein